MKLKLWQWLVGVAVVAVLILAGVALGHKWQVGHNAVPSSNKVNPQSLQSPQDTKVPTVPSPAKLQ